ncbi:kinase-like domain-containing protein [Fusarium heterosporum]|uniref:Kinase-like domain-containing protein n=1 Tax=Fusarium heterosporum TaxID=42747 RepID=A0A8H5WVH7_FUSHE|nr:kinase-like domain-containing protein [Fusarium heterosporum]
MLSIFSSLFQLFKRKLEDWVFPLRMRFGRKILYQYGPRQIVQVSRHQLIKGPCNRQELEAMQYAASQTSICLPSIHRIYDRGGKLFIAMEFIQGDMLDKLWPTLTEGKKESIVAEIWVNLRQLHACQPPTPLGSIVAASISGGPVRDGAFGVGDHGPHESGPFIREAEFIDHLKAIPDLIQDNLFPKRVGFVYGDLALRNIVLKRDGHLCFLDWENAGWWPLYWERIKWHFSSFGEPPDFVELMDKISASQRLTTT